MNTLSQLNNKLDIKRKGRCVMKKVIFIFAFRGFWLWLLCGVITAMVSFKPIIPLELIKDNEEVLKEYQSAWSGLMFKTSAIWAISGIIMGILVWVIFTFRPPHEHKILMPRVAPDSPFGSGPKTLAEAKSTFIVIFVSLIFVSLVYRFILPMTLGSQQFLELNQSKGPMIISCIQTGILSNLILPFSLKKIENLVRCGELD